MKFMMFFEDKKTLNEFLDVLRKHHINARYEVKEALICYGTRVTHYIRGRISELKEKYGRYPDVMERIQLYEQIMNSIQKHLAEKPANIEELVDRVIEDMMPPEKREKYREIYKSMLTIRKRMQDGRIDDEVVEHFIKTFLEYPGEDLDENEQKEYIEFLLRCEDGVDGVLDICEQMGIKEGADGLSGSIDPNAVVDVKLEKDMAEDLEDVRVKVRHFFGTGYYLYIDALPLITHMDIMAKCYDDGLIDNEAFCSFEATYVLLNALMEMLEERGKIKMDELLSEVGKVAKHTFEDGTVMECAFKQPIAKDALRFLAKKGFIKIKGNNLLKYVASPLQ